MCMYARVCVCVCPWACVCSYACVFVCVRGRGSVLFVSGRMHVPVHIQMRLHVRMHVQEDVVACP
jgi:hypothetical protein